MKNKRIYLAPMVGRTDEHYRMFIRFLSKNINLYTEMITCDSFIHTDRKSYTVKPDESNLTIQLAGSEPEKYGICAKIIESKGYDEINLNIGCPSDKVIKGKFGACLMNSPKLVADCILEIKNACDLPISIKTRLGLGYDEDLSLLFELINETRDVGCEKYFIHARNAILTGLSPKKNRKIPKLRYEDVVVVRNKYKDIELYLNGGLEGISDIKNNISIFDGLMIGRKIYDDPMFLRKIDKEIYNNEDVITREDIIEKYLRYAAPLSKRGISNYQLLRHLYGLYYNTSSAKKWKKYLHGIIQDEKDIMMVSDFKELAYEEKISSYS